MINAAHFLEHFRAIADNFDWQVQGHRIYALKRGMYFDPLTALVWISQGVHLDRHQVDTANQKLHLPDSSFADIMKALYNPNYADKKIGALRVKLEKACRLHSYQEAT